MTTEAIAAGEADTREYEDRSFDERLDLLIKFLHGADYWTGRTLIEAKALLASSRPTPAPDDKRLAEIEARELVRVWAGLPEDDLDNRPGLQRLYRNITTAYPPAHARGWVVAYSDREERLFREMFAGTPKRVIRAGRILAQKDKAS